MLPTEMAITLKLVVLFVSSCTTQTINGTRPLNTTRNNTFNGPTVLELLQVPMDDDNVTFNRVSMMARVNSTWSVKRKPRPHVFVIPQTLNKGDLRAILLNLALYRRGEQCILSSNGSMDACKGPWIKVTQGIINRVVEMRGVLDRPQSHLKALNSRLSDQIEVGPDVEITVDPPFEKNLSSRKYNIANGNFKARRRYVLFLALEANKL